LAVPIIIAYVRLRSSGSCIRGASTGARAFLTVAGNDGDSLVGASVDYDTGWWCAQCLYACESSRHMKEATWGICKRKPARARGSSRVGYAAVHFHSTRLKTRLRVVKRCAVS